MSNSTERKHPRKQEHPRTLAFRCQSYPYDTYGTKLDEMYSYMTSENTSYFGDDADQFPKNIGTYRFAYELPNKIMSLGILKYGFEKEIDEFYAEHLSSKDHYKHSECECTDPWDNFCDPGVNTFEEDSPFRFFYFLGTKSENTDSWQFKLHIDSSLQPIICHAMTEQEYNIYYEETYGLCYDCKGEIGYMSGQCADCYWEEDSQRKSRRRSFYYNNPDLFSAWQSHCRHTFYPNEEIIVSDLLRNHIPKSIAVDSSKYNTYIEKFKAAIVEGMMPVMSLLKEINPDYTPIYDESEEEENKMK